MCENCSDSNAVRPRKVNRNRNHRNGIAIAVSVVIVLAFLVPTGSVKASPNIPCYCPTCGVCGGGSCLTPYQFDLTASVTSSATGATIVFEPTASSPAQGGTANVSFGPTTSYSYTIATGQPFSGVNQGRDSVDFLDPSTTYYYEVVASGTCTDSKGVHWYHGTWTGSSATGVDTYGPTTISGQVFNTNFYPGVANMLVEASCAVPQGLSPDYVGTGANGVFTVGVPTEYINGQNVPCPQGGGIMVSLINSAVIPPGGSGYSTIWPGYFNESIVVWAPEAIDFVLPSNYVSSYLPVITDLSNANSSNGLAGYSTISYQSGTTYTTSEKDCATGGFVAGGCSTSSTQFGAGSIYQSTNGNLFVSQQYWTSGLTIIDGLNRTGWTASQNYYAPYGYPQFPGQQPIGDWLTPSTYLAHNAYPMPGWGDLGTGRPVYYQHSIGGYVTTSTTRATTGVKDLAISVDVSYFVGVGFQVADLSWSQTSSATVQNTLTWMAQIPVNTPAPTCFVVYGQGGSASAGTADIIGIWAYASTYSGGLYTCGTPH